MRDQAHRPGVDPGFWFGVLCAAVVLVLLFAVPILWLLILSS